MDAAEGDVSLLPWPYAYTPLEQEIVEALYQSKAALDTLELMRLVISNRAAWEEYSDRAQRAYRNPMITFWAGERVNKNLLSLGEMEAQNIGKAAIFFIECIFKRVTLPPLSAKVMDLLSRAEELSIPNYNGLNRTLLHLKKVGILKVHGKGKTEAIRVWYLNPKFAAVLEKRKGGTHDAKS